MTTHQPNEGSEIMISFDDVKNPTEIKPLLNRFRYP